MSDVANYSAHEHLRDGSPVEIRALRPDKADICCAGEDQRASRSSAGSS